MIFRVNILKTFLLFSIIFFTSGTSLGEDYTFEADSMLIEKKGMRYFEKKYNSKKLKSLDNQLFISRFLSFISNFSESFTKKLRVNKFTGYSYISKLESQYKYEDILKFIRLQRFVHDDELMFYKRKIETLLQLQQFNDVLEELERVAENKRGGETFLRESIRELDNKLKNDTMKITQEFFKSFREDNKMYNKTRLFYYIYLKPQKLPRIIRDYNSDYVKSLEESLELITKEYDRPKLLSEVYNSLKPGIREKLSFSAVFDVNMELRNLDTLRKLQDKMNKGMYAEYLKVYFDSNFTESDLDTAEDMLERVPFENQNSKLLKYSFAFYLKKGNKKKFLNKLRKSKIEELTKEYFYYWSGLLELTDTTSTEKKALASFLRSRKDSPYYSDLLLWYDLIRNLDKNTKARLRKIFLDYLTFNRKDFLKKVDRIKQRSIEFEIIFSFLEQRFKDPQCNKEDLKIWYKAVKTTDKGRLLLILAEDFFNSDTLRSFYSKMLKKEKESEWKRFISNRLLEYK